MEYKRIAFKPYATNAYSACSAPGEGLEDSMGGNWIVLDTPGYIKAQVTFFGEMHQGVYVSSNGHITFGEPDHTKNKGNWEEHWKKPRISVLFADLKPELKPGAVKYKFAEGNGEAKLVITWDHVPGESHSSLLSPPSPPSPLSLPLLSLSSLSLSLSLSLLGSDGWMDFWGNVLTIFDFDSLFVSDGCAWWGCWGSSTAQATLPLSGPRKGEIILSYRSVSTGSPIIVGLSPG